MYSLWLLYCTQMRMRTCAIQNAAAAAHFALITGNSSLYDRVKVHTSSNQPTVCVSLARRRDLIMCIAVSLLIRNVMWVWF